MEWRTLILISLFGSVVSSENIFARFLGQFRERSGAVDARGKLRRETDVRCDENQLMLHLANLGVVSPDRIISLASSQDLDGFCRKVAATVKSSEKELGRCLGEPEGHLFIKLLNGTLSFHHFLCRNKRLRRSFESHQKCYLSLHEEFVDCEGPDDWYESVQVCETMSTILNCYYERTALLCGIKAAHYVFVVGKEVFAATVEPFCHGVATEPNFPEALAASSSSSLRSGSTHTFAVILISWLRK